MWRRETEKGFFYASTKKARAAGLRPRSSAETFGPIDTFLRDHLDFDFTVPGNGPAIARHETALLAAWREKKSLAVEL
ncbi:MAG: hypothetical protein KY459_00330 [Acidobacteria bacterium]|nr:hypothetical protein [Acidobacteriota bacterium]